MTKQYPLPLPHHEAMDVDDFLVTASNREARMWVDAWPEWPASCLVVYGPSGCGKTHLSRLWLTRSHGRVIQASDLTDLDAGLLVTQHRVLLIDTIDPIAGDARREESLLHLYNLIKECKGSLLLTATVSPVQWNMGLADLRSRILSVPAIAIAPPDDQLLTALLIKQFRDRQIDISMDVINYLLPRIERTSAAIRDAVIALDRASLAERCGITLPLARRVLFSQDS